MGFGAATDTNALTPSSAALVAVGLVFGRPFLARRTDVARWRAIYGQAPIYPGATKTREVVEEVRADGVPQGEYSLRLVYELPSSATASEVLAFLRSHLPSEWRTASTDTCRAHESQYAPPMTAQQRRAGASPPSAFKSGYELPGEFRKLFLRMPGFPFLVRYRAFPRRARPGGATATRPRFPGVRQPIFGRQLGLLGRCPLGCLRAGPDLRSDLRFLCAVEMLTEWIRQMETK